jgi:hypothetical protein
MDEETRNVLAAETLAAIEELGVPSGAWLVDLERMREDLHHTDKVLRRMENAIIRSVRPFDDGSNARPTGRSQAIVPRCGWRAARRARTRR